MWGRKDRWLRDLQRKPSFWTIINSRGGFREKCRLQGVYWVWIVVTQRDVPIAGVSGGVVGRISLDSNEVWALVTESSVGGRGSTEALEGELWCSILGTGLIFAHGVADSFSIEGCLLHLLYGGGERERRQGFKLTGGPMGDAIGGWGISAYVIVWVWLRRLPLYLNPWRHGFLTPCLHGFK